MGEPRTYLSGTVSKFFMVLICWKWFDMSVDSTSSITNARNSLHSSANAELILHFCVLLYFFLGCIECYFYYFYFFFYYLFLLSISFFFFDTNKWLIDWLTYSHTFVDIFYLTFYSRVTFISQCLVVCCFEDNRVQ